MTPYHHHSLVLVRKNTGIMYLDQHIALFLWLVYVTVVFSHHLHLRQCPHSPLPPSCYSKHSQVVYKRSKVFYSTQTASKAHID